MYNNVILLNDNNNNSDEHSLDNGVFKDCGTDPNHPIGNMKSSGYKTTVFSSKKRVCSMDGFVEYL